MVFRRGIKQHCIDLLVQYCSQRILVRANRAEAYWDLKLAGHPRCGADFVCGGKPDASTLNTHCRPDTHAGAGRALGTKASVVGVGVVGGTLALVVMVLLVQSRSCAGSC